jgi:hypothetical protein
LKVSQAEKLSWKITPTLIESGDGFGVEAAFLKSNVNREPQQAAQLVPLGVFYWMFD